MTGFIDSHAHLADPAFDDDRDAVIDRARGAGARAIVCIGESLAAARARARRSPRAHPGFVWFTAGVHPHDAARVRRRARHRGDSRATSAAGAVAVGECGLDYHYDHSPARAAARARSPRSSRSPREVGAPRRRAHARGRGRHARDGARGGARAACVGVLHCYTGSHALAEAALDVGWYVSFSGIVTFRKWTDDALLRLVPDDRLLVESDAPYLAPVPHRGKRNEPAWVALTVDRLARRARRGAGHGRAPRHGQRAALLRAGGHRGARLDSRAVPAVRPTPHIPPVPDTRLTHRPHRRRARRHRPVLAGRRRQRLSVHGGADRARSGHRCRSSRATSSRRPSGCSQNLARRARGRRRVVGRVVKTTVFLARHGATSRAVNEVYARALGDARPARSTVAVAGLPRDVRVEIEVVAALPGDI